MAFSAETFAARLREARQARGLTQVELAARIEGHQPDVADYEGGQRIVSLETAVRLADALFVTLDYLAGRTAAGGPADPQPPRRRKR